MTMPLEFSNLKNWIQLLLKSTSPFVSGVNEYNKICGKCHSKKAAMISDYWPHLIRTIIHLTEKYMDNSQNSKSQLRFYATSVSFVCATSHRCMHDVPDTFTLYINRCQNTADEHEILGNE